MDKFSFAYNFWFMEWCIIPNNYYSFFKIVLIYLYQFISEYFPFILFIFLCLGGFIYFSFFTRLAFFPSGSKLGSWIFIYFLWQVGFPHISSSLFSLPGFLPLGTPPFFICSQTLFFPFHPLGVLVFNFHNFSNGFGFGISTQGF